MNSTAAAGLPSLDRILVVKLADLGDAVLATSAVAALRGKYPGARIDVLTAGAGAAAFRLCPAIDQTIALDKYVFDHPSGLINPRNAAKLMRLAARLRRGRYEAIVLLHHLTTAFGAAKFRWLCRAVGAPVRAGLDNGRGSFLTHRALDYGFGSKSVREYGLDVVSLLDADVRETRPAIVIPESARRSADHLLQQRDVHQDFIVIHPSVGGFSRARNWFPERYGEVARTITERFGVAVVLVGAGDARDSVETIRRLAAVVDLTDQTSLSELGAVIQRARLVIGADSGVVHLAAALGAPTVAIFGPSNHSAWMPFGATVVDASSGATPKGTTVVVRADLPCSPCFYAGYALGRKDGCALRTCLDAITAERVTQIATKIMAQTAQKKSANS